MNEGHVTSAGVETIAVRRPSDSSENGSRGHACGRASRGQNDESGWLADRAGANSAQLPRRLDSSFAK